MIIFDLDGTLANCEHRRHFVEPPEDSCHNCYEMLTSSQELRENPFLQCHCGSIPGIWKPDRKAFYDACIDDTPIESTKIILYNLWVREGENIQIWSGRCESIRYQTEDWINKFLLTSCCGDIPKIKMRPIGDNTPDDQLKERWLDEALARGEKIEFVFDSDPDSIAMWRRRGVFVFDCNQIGREF